MNPIHGINKRQKGLNGHSNDILALRYKEYFSLKK